MPRATLHKQNLKLHKNQLLFSGSAVIFTTLLGLFTVNFFQIFASDNSYAETHTDSASGAYNGTTYSMTTTVSDLNLELYNVTPAGKATYGKQTVNVTTNAPGGYQLYVQTSGNLAGTKAGTATSDSIAALPSNNAALDMNTWGYTKTTPNEDANIAATESIWNTPPSTITQVDATSSAATSGRDTDIYYGIKADNTLSGDNYSGTITYTTIASDVTSADESTNGLTVSPTSGTAGTASTLTITTPLMASSSLTASEITATVGSYSCTSIAITSQAPLTFTCSVTASNAGTYNVSATISKYSKTYTKSSAYTIKTPDLSSITNMQDASIASRCKDSKETLSTSDVTTYQLTDTRNSQRYYVRKFNFNNVAYCIMVENLYLPGARTITNADSNVAGSYSIPSSSSTNYINGGPAYQMNNGGRNRNGFTQQSGSLTYPADGSYYNWCVATAGTGGCYGSNQAAGTYDICPKYWRLPYFYETAYIKSRISSIGVNTFFASSTGAATPPILSGYYYKSSLSAVGTNNYWWTSTQGSDFPESNAGQLYAYSGGIGNGANNYKFYGHSVRCLVQAAS